MFFKYDMIELLIGGNVMQQTTKEKILECARTLFNEKGYQNVKMRDISNLLEISVGNLTYHFRRKEDLLKALMENAAPLENKKLSHTLSDLNNYLSEMLISIQNYLFFFISDELSHLDLQFTQTNQEKIDALKHRLIELILDLKKHGYFSTLLTDSTIIALSEMMMLSHLAWARKINVNSNSTFSLQEFIDVHWQLLMPYFTEKAKAEYQSL